MLGADPLRDLGWDSGWPAYRCSCRPEWNRSAPLREVSLELVDRDQHAASIQRERLDDWDDGAADRRRADA